MASGTGLLEASVTVAVTTVVDPTAVDWVLGESEILAGVSGRATVRGPAIPVMTLPNPLLTDVFPSVKKYCGSAF